MTAATGDATSALHAHFLSIMPRIETHARIYFRHVRCPGRRADAVAETIAVAWKWYLRLAEQRREVDGFVSTLARYAASHVRGGRRLCGQERSKDALSPLAQARHGFRVEPLPASTRRSHEHVHGGPRGQGRLDAFEERLKDNTQSPVPDQAAFRIDYPAWLARLGTRDCEIARDMALDLGTQELAARHKLSQGRISQLRREFHRDWRRFHGEVS